MLTDIADLLSRAGLLVATRGDWHDAGSTQVTGVDCDSRVVAPGHLFVCKGVAFKDAYLASALEAGAVGYLCDAERTDELARAARGVPAIVASDLRRAMALASAAAWGHPDHDLSVVGITGTKGKSTVSYMLKEVLDEGSDVPRTCVIGSIETFDGVERIESHNTTPEAPDLWRHLANARDSGLAYADIEVTSQALKYDRVRGLDIDVACFLNISRDHISPAEHPDFADYFASKLRIFDQAKVGVVNLACDHADEVLAAASRCERIVRFSADGPRDGLAEVWAEGIEGHQGSISFVAHTPSWTGEVTLGMSGLFNVDNALAAIAIAEVLGIPQDQVAAGLAKAKVPGRMELLGDAADKVVGLVDYAHNKLSYQRLFPSVEAEFPGRRIIVVLGAPGGKAYERRRELPEEAAKHADLLIYAEEDPGPESAEDICRQMAEATPAGAAYEVIVDREEAIRHAVEVGLEGDGPAIVCMLAKGDETRQHVGDEFVPSRPDGEIFLDALEDLAEGGASR